jgi:hypothetical protein
LAARADVFPVPYTGQLSISGSPANGRHFFQFALYGAPVGGSALYSQAESLTVVNGVYSTFLNTPDTVWGDAVWIGVAVDVGAELVPRVPVGSVPYSIMSAWSKNGRHAVNADTAGVALSPSAAGLTWRPGPTPKTLSSTSVAALIDSITIVCPGPGAVMVIASGTVYPNTSTSGVRLSFSPAGVLYWDVVGTVPQSIPYCCVQSFPVYSAGPMHFDLMGLSSTTSYPTLLRQSINALYVPKLY